MGFGAGRGEGDGAAARLDRYNAPVLSADENVFRHTPDEPLIHGDARDMRELKDSSVALVVTAPPAYDDGPYEITDVASPSMPYGYVDHLDLLRDVFLECVRVLEPGGRIAVTVANIGRKPYRSVSADVINILQDDLGLLIRGEIVWMKARGAGSNVAWGSYRSPKNPVIRDVTERVIVAAKGRFDRALDTGARKKAGLPHAATLTSDEFQEATLDFWEIPPEAEDVDHPSPFPVALPQRLIELYTYADDLVLDPFMGSGSTAVAAVRSGRRFAGYDIDPAHIATAMRRVETEQVEAAGRVNDPTTLAFHEARVRGSAMRKLIAEVISESGFTGIREDAKVAKVSLTAPAAARDGSGRRWLFEMAGAFSVVPTGLDWTDAALAAVGRGAVIAGATGEPPILFVPQLPERGSPVDIILRAAGPSALFDVVEVFAPESRRRLARYASGAVNSPLPGFWTPAEVAVESTD